ncbi:DUF5110 domain-containing protein [Ilyomonas limi]|uniref:DUF5110 domain-containing protein n=1 Tax=Ilyomonas limi TaxID=2575867 RepID=A0A4U3L196_9BACT|nr:TIM-barrel domain-containing protein [Ilyomonas limi]TKK68901.1 DUF5110 domain-containing protein [Ilyomonas limi]
MRNFLFKCSALLLTSCFLASHFAFAQQPFEKKADGIVVHIQSPAPGSAKTVRLQVIKDNIIRVSSTPANNFSPDTSLIIVYKNNNTGQFTATQNGDTVYVKTNTLTAKVLVTNGLVSFAKSNGEAILQEKRTADPMFKTAVFDGQPLYNINETFQTTDDDAWYGLGQHQSDVFNYRNHQVYLFQNNTEVAVPFLISRNNYGILWDNYSLTTVGNTRQMMPLSAFQLFSKDGTEGWLTATYRNNANDANAKTFQRAESDINYPFLSDTKLFLPDSFDVANGSITWEGSIASGFSGAHTLHFTYAGYVKVWLDGKLLFDRWRQAWNPGAAEVLVDLEKNKQYPIKIEWIPNGGESYLSAKWLNPAPEAAKNTFGFSSEAGKQMDYYFVYGQNMDSVITGYRLLTGKATIVPKWAMGFWQSRERYKTEEEILNTIAEFRKRRIPIDNIVQDWSYWKQEEWGSQQFDESRFPSPDSMIAQLHNKYHAHFMISVWPKFYEGIPNYTAMNEKGYLYKRNVADRQRDWIAQGYVSTFYDAFNPAARSAFWSLINKNLYSKGIDAWWMDASEPDILSNVSPEKRILEMTPVSLGPAAEYLNAYPLENAKGIFEGQRSVDPNKRVFLLTRSGFAGSQHYAAAIWSGDIAARWSDMKAQISAGINFSMSGIPYWTMDIGGFAVERRYEHPNATDLKEWQELQTRWYQFGTFCPLFRSHGQYPYREIFNIADEESTAYQSMLYYDKLRYRLMPYIYSLAGATHYKDYTIMRGLVMDFAKDTAVTNIGDQFMFGPALLINPVYTYNATNRKLYLPAGQGWYDIYSSKYYTGGQWITADAPYERMPLFVKEGSIVPTGPALQYTSEKKADPITLFVYTGKDGSFSLYEDGDTTYDYEKGAYSIIPFTYNEATKTLTIGKREGTYDGMLTNRTCNVVWINKNSNRALDFDKKPDASVQYNGNTVSLKMRK